LKRELLQEYRRSQPVSELRRKVRKSDGRHSKNLWTAEQLDLNAGEAREISKFFNIREGKD
jgi:hypothetical protein